METAKDRPEKDPEPIGDPVPEPAPRDDVLAKASPVRCPFCHTDVRVDVDAWVACRGCLARHHVACWQERGACSACGTTAALNATVLGELTPRSARPAGSRNLSIAAFGLIAFVGLFGLLLLGVGAWLATARGRVERTTPAPVFAEQPTYTPPRPADARYWDAIRACAKVPHSSDRADALCKIAGKELSPAEIVLLLEQTRGVEHRSDRARVLSAVVEGAGERPMGVAAELTYVNVAFEMEHSSDQTAALLAMLQSRPLASSTRARITDALERIGSSDDRGRVIDALVEFAPRD